MGERRSDEEIRREIATARTQLADALGDLSRAAGRRRERATVTGRAVAAGLTLAAVARAVRRLRRR